MKHSLKISIIIFFLFSVSFSQEMENIELTGNLNYDSKLTQMDYETAAYNNYIQLPVDGKKSPILGGLMSLVVPGAGEFYAGDYWKTAIFVAIEATAIGFAITYDKKGDEQTEKFENFADENWSVVKYAQWLKENRGGDIYINPDESLPPWQRVDFDEIRAVEDQFSDLSHNIPPYGDQQYYELIGKYPQYSPGWNDFDGGTNLRDYSPNFLNYSQMRGQANDYYTTAKTAVIGIYINHFLSALDAVWSVSQYNNELAMNVRVETLQLVDKVEYVPTLNVSFSF